MKKVIITACLLTLTSKALAGAFGAEWGWSYQQLIKAGAVCQAEAMSNFDGYRCSKMPRNFSNADFWFAIFDKKNGLQKITMVGTDITDDPYGTEGKKRYNGLKSAITKKYGPPSDKYVLETTGLTLWDDADEFYQCLAYSGCGYYSSLWDLEGNGGTISVEIKGASRGQGWITLVYEGPRWSDSIDRVNNAREQADLDAL